MKGNLILLSVMLLAFIFCRFYNGNCILKMTQEQGLLEKHYKAQMNINVELQIEHDDLISGKHISSLVPIELKNYIPNNHDGSVIYVHETKHSQDQESYSIIDLIATKAEAATVSVIPD